MRTIFDNNFAVDGGVRYQFSETVAFQARLEVGEDTYFGIGVRYTF